MYESFYGLSELPFELTANPKYLFLSARQREALSTLQYGLFSAKSLTLLIGEAGTGKTTLIQAALESERCRDVRCIYLNNPTLRPDDFIRLLALKFDLGPEAGESKALLLERLEVLLARTARGRGDTALVVDEAQSLSRRAARRDTPPGEHRNSRGQAAAAGAGRTAGAGGAARRAEPSAVEAARHAACAARAIRARRTRRPTSPAGSPPPAATRRASSASRPSRSFTSSPAAFRERSA